MQRGAEYGYNKSLVVYFYDHSVLGGNSISPSTRVINVKVKTLKRRAVYQARKHWKLNLAVLKHGRWYLGSITVAATLTRQSFL